MDEPIVVGIDVGTSKICTLVARVEGERSLRILGVGIEPAQGIKKGTVVDIAAATQSIARSVEKAERSSGLEITSAIVSLAGSHVSSVNSRGVVGIAGRVIDHNDVTRALEAAQAVAIPHNREIIHVIQRSFTVDGQDGIHMPIGMHGFRLEVEAHIITAAAATVENIRQAVSSAGVQTAQFVLNPLASGEVVLSETERQMGAVVVDIGGGTTSMAVYIDGDVWHTMVLGVGGTMITSDIAHGLRLPISQAEDIKLAHGHAMMDEVSDDDKFTIRAFGEDAPIQVSRKELAEIIEARVEEIFSLLLQEIKRSGYDGLLPAGMVLTGGTSQLPGIRNLASQVMGLPVRVARPENLLGLTDQLLAPPYSTSVGLLYWALMMSESNLAPQKRGSAHNREGIRWDSVKDFLKRLLP
jgi:cell division protein FtsA